ncbi:MAG: M23 family metallopeptidase [Bacteroidota bacterium]
MRQEYIYDPETCEYVPLKRDFRFYFKKWSLYVLVSSVVGVLFVYLFFLAYDSRTTHKLRKENAMLASSIEQNASDLAYFNTLIDSLKEREKELYRTALNAEPIEKSEDKIAQQIDSSFSRKSIYELAEEMMEMHKSLEENSEKSARILQSARSNTKALESTPSIRPVDGEIISGHGTRKHPISKQDKMHYGIDFMAKVGTPVKATATGYVAEAGVKKNGRGKYIVINHGEGYKTRYSHLSELKVRRGQHIKRGDVIALSGNSGLSKGPHLHYEVLYKGESIDPIDFFADLTPEQFVKFKEKAKQYNESMN